MSLQEPTLGQPPLNGTSKPSSDIEFEAAEQLLQHSRAGREANGDSMGLVAEHRSSSDFATNLRVVGEEQRSDNGQLEQGQDEQSPSQDRHADSHYAPISNPPALGQVCR